MKIKTHKEAQAIEPFTLSKDDGNDVVETLIIGKNSEMLIQHEVNGGQEKFGGIIYCENCPRLVQICTYGWMPQGNAWQTIISNAEQRFIVTVCDEDGSVIERDIITLAVEGRKILEVYAQIANLDLFLARRESKGKISHLESMQKAISTRTLGLFGGTPCEVKEAIGLFIDGKRVSYPAEYTAIFPDTQWSAEQLTAIFELFHTYCLELNSKDEYNPIEDIFEGDSLIDCCPVEIEEAEDISDEALEAYENEDYTNQELREFVYSELDACGELAWKGSNGMWYCMPNEGYRMLSRATCY